MTTAHICRFAGPFARTAVALALLAATLATAATVCPGCRQAALSPQGSGRLMIFAAANLSRPMAALVDAFQKDHPGVRIDCEYGGSQVLCRKIADMGRSADLVAVSDPLVFDQILLPAHASWYVNFAGNELGIAYTQASKYQAEITSDNWYDVLARPDVRVGRVDENKGPIGYWTLQCWLLADRYYADRPGGSSISRRLKARVAARDILPDINAFLPRLAEGGVDYVFMHRSMAEQHNLKFIALPDEINLSRMDQADTYAKVQVEIDGARPGERLVQVAHPIVYAVTIPTGATNPELAGEFLWFMLSGRGRAIMEKEYQPTLSPPQPVHAERMPANLRAVFPKEPT